MIEEQEMRLQGQAGPPESRRCYVDGTTAGFSAREKWDQIYSFIELTIWARSFQLSTGLMKELHPKSQLADGAKSKHEALFGQKSLSSV